MPTFNEYFEESLKNIGSMKVKRLEKPGKSFKFLMSRGQNRKNLRQVPASQDSYEPNNYTGQVGISNLTNNVVKMAKKSPRGVWRIPLSYAKEIAKKYHFHVPDQEKRSKHLGSTGIQVVFYRPGVYYLYKKKKLDTRGNKKEFKKEIEKRLKGFHKFKD